MTTTFKIIIAATDKATAIVRGVKAEIASVTGPVGDLYRSMQNLGRETGLNHLVNGLRRGASAALSMARSVALLSAPIAALAGAGIVAGVASIATGWGRAAQELTNTSAILGVGTNDLQRYRGAAQLAGLSATEMDSALQGLGNTLQGAQFGRNSQALSLMNAYGMSIKRTKDGAIDTTAALSDLASMIQRNLHSGGTVQSASLIAGTFGVESLLPLLLKGAPAIRDFVGEVDRLNATMSPEQIAAGEQYGKNLSKLDLVVTNLKNSLGNALLPVLSDIVTSMTERLSDPEKKQKVIDAVTTAVNFLADSLKSIDWNEVKSGAKDLFDTLSKGYDAIKPLIDGMFEMEQNMERLGNWLRGRGGVTNREIASSGAAISPAFDGLRNGDDRATQQTKALFDGLEQRDHLPAGLLDSIWAQESGRGLRMRSPAGAKGHFQFMDATARQYGLQNPDDLTQSADAASRLMKDLLRQNDSNLPRALAAYNWGQGNLDRRGMANAPAETTNYIREVSEKLATAQANGAGNVPTLYPPRDSAADSSDRTNRLADLQQQAGNVHVQIEMKNAPRGTRLNAQADGPVKATTRIGYSMDGTNG